MYKSVSILLSAGYLLGCSSLAREREISALDLNDIFLQSRQNSVWSIWLVRETESYYHIELEQSPLHKQKFRVSKEDLRVSCADGARPPCALKQNNGIWRSRMNH